MIELYRRVAAYQTAMSLARNMVRRGIINRDDYRKIDTIIANKHGVSLYSLFRFQAPELLDNTDF